MHKHAHIQCTHTYVIVCLVVKTVLTLSVALLPFDVHPDTGIATKAAYPDTGIATIWHLYFFIHIANVDSDARH